MENAVKVGSVMSFTAIENTIRLLFKKIGFRLGALCLSYGFRRNVMPGLAFFYT